MVQEANILVRELVGLVGPVWLTHLPNFLKMSFWGMHFQSEIGSLVLENKKLETLKRNMVTAFSLQVFAVVNTSEVFGFIMIKYIIIIVK